MSLTPRSVLLDHGNVGHGYAVSFGKRSATQLLRSGADFPNLLDCQFGAIPTPDVLGRSNRLHMLGVATCPLPTQMVQVHAVGDGAEPILIKALVSRYRTSANHITAITSGRNMAIGNPTWRDKPAIFSRDNQGGRQFVTSNEPEVLAGADTSLHVTALCDRGSSAATTLTQTRRIRAFARILDITHGIVSYTDGLVGRDRGRSNAARSFAAWNYTGLQS